MFNRLLGLVVLCFGMILVVSCATTANRNDYYKEYMQTVIAKVENAGRHIALSGAEVKLAAQVDLVITADGSLESVRIVRSSGNDEFDRAVVRIAYAAAPFLPFPEEIRRETDVLHIVRTWRYGPSN